MRYTCCLYNKWTIHIAYTHTQKRQIIFFDIIIIIAIAVQQCRTYEKRYGTTSEKKQNKMQESKTAGKREKERKTEKEGERKKKGRNQCI